MMRLYAILTKEFRQILRDPLSLGMLIAVPALLLILYGYALSFDVRHVRIAVLDEDRTPQSRALLDSLFQNPYFDRKGTLACLAEAGDWLRRGTARAVLVIPRGHAAALARGETAPVQALVDGSDANSAGVVIGYLDALADRFNLAAPGRAQVPPGPSIRLEPRFWFNPGLDSAHFLVTGLIGMLMMLSAVIATSLSIVREKERETMEQIRVSPARPWELIIGKLLPYILICVLTMAMVMLLGRILFGVTMRGSYALLSLATLLFLFAALGMGLLISSATRSQQEAFQIATMTTLIPALTLSGLIFPIASMPAPVRAVTLLVVPRYFTEALRAIILKDAPAAAIWPSLLGMLVLGILFNLLAARNMARAR
ncbi:MAG: ABC transporter permease [Lentisphaerae bacterium]|nr:ABC transporter permease [Lentisphaerota bacterium]